MSTDPLTTVRLCHLYPGEMNIYADRGNIAVLQKRLAWRGLALHVTPAGIGDLVRPGDHDLFYLGGGQDRDQALVAAPERVLEEAVSGVRGKVVLKVFGTNLPQMRADLDQAKNALKAVPGITDLNQDGITDAADLAVMLRAWGACP